MEDRAPPSHVHVADRAGPWRTGPFPVHVNTQKHISKQHDMFVCGTDKACVAGRAVDEMLQVL